MNVAQAGIPNREMHKEKAKEREAKVKAILNKVCGMKDKAPDAVKAGGRREFVRKVRTEIRCRVRVETLNAVQVGIPDRVRKEKAGERVAKVKVIPNKVREAITGLLCMKKAKTEIKSAWRRALNKARNRRQTVLLREEQRKIMHGKI